MYKAFLAAAVAALMAGSASAQQHFSFSESFAYGFSTATGDLPVSVTGSFDGTLNGNLITGLSNISVFLNGQAFHGNGALYAGHYDDNLGYVSGGGVVSLDGTASNFIFIDTDYSDSNPASYNYLNYFISNLVVGDTAALFADTSHSNYLYGGADTYLSGLRVAAVPEPASWALMLGGLALVGSVMRSRRRSSIRFA